MSETATRQRWIAHVDLDAFFASCEQLANPDYRGRPVVVGARPGRRGVVAAASYEARAFGIHSAMPIAEAYRRCPGAVYLRPDMQKYARASQQVFDVLATVTPIVEGASIDEAYLDVSGLEKLIGPPERVGSEIRRRIVEDTGLTASVGIGPNRLIAKLASECCKPDGLRVVRPDEVLDFLAPMPVANLRGLGRQMRKVFARLNIETVEQLRHYPPAELERHVGQKAAASFRRQALGRASAEILPERQRKSISKETTFETDVLDADLLHDQLRELAAGVAAIARREGLAGAVVTLKTRFAPFDTHTRQVHLSTPTNDERQILLTAWRLFRHSNLPRQPVRLIGIGISGWDSAELAQADLFDQPSQAAEQGRLLSTIDDVNERFGKGKLRIGMARSGSGRAN